MGCVQRFLYHQTSLWPFGAIFPELMDISLAVGCKSIGERVSKHMKELSKIPLIQHLSSLLQFAKKKKKLEKVSFARSHAVCWCIQFGSFTWEVHFLLGKSRQPQITMIWSKYGDGGCTVFCQQRGDTPPLSRDWARWAKSGIAFCMRPCLGLKG